MKKIKTGIVGCGRIAKFHFNALQELSLFYEMIAVTDIQSNRATLAAKELGTNHYDSIEAMLEKENLDLVVLCTPSGLHPTHARVCAEAGIACLSEKPFGCYYDEALNVVNLFEQKKVPLFIVHQNRYNPTIQQVRKWHQQGLFGQLYMIQANVFWQRPQSYYDAENWRGKRHLDGGAFMNQASHYLDLMQWFGGEVDSVKSEVATLERRIECEDTGAAIIRFKSKAIGVISVTMLTYPENQEGSLTLLAENATIKIGGKALNKLETCVIKNMSDEFQLDHLNYEPKTIYGHGHKIYYEKLIEYLKDPHHSDAINGREALKSLKLLTDIYKNSKCSRAL